MFAVLGGRAVGQAARRAGLVSFAFHMSMRGFSTVVRQLGLRFFPCKFRVHLCHLPEPEEDRPALFSKHPAGAARWHTL